MGTSIFSSIKFSSMIFVILSMNSLSILFNDSLMIDCLRWVLEDIKEAIFFLPSNRLATLLLSKDALKGLVT